MLAAGALAAPAALVLAEPVLDPAAYFGDIERVGRQARLGAGGVPGWAFAHPLPEAIRGPESAVSVASVLREFSGTRGDCSPPAASTAQA